MEFLLVYWYIHNDSIQRRFNSALKYKFKSKKDIFLLEMADHKKPYPPKCMKRLMLKRN